MVEAPVQVAPEPPGYPLVGHLPAFRRKRLDLLNACVATRSDVVELRIGGPAYLLKRPEDVRHVLVAGHAVHVKSPRNTGPTATRIFGDGLMTSTDEAHRRMRRRAQPAFRRQSVARLTEVIVRGVDAMIDRWDNGADIDLADEMTGLALQTVIGSVFGVESGSALTALEDGVVARRRSMSRARASLTTRPGFLPIAMRPRRRRDIRRLDATLERLIQAHRQQAGPHDDLLSMVMDTHEGGRSASDPRQAHDEALTLALAAYENIARALTYTFLALAQHPHAEARVRAEVQRVLGDRAPTADDCQRLHYTDMALAESMRLWPPTALIFRVARRDDVLPTGASIRAGSKLLLSPYVIHRDPAYYPDPERFDPERFSEEGKHGRPKYAYFPFGGGPRVCIGQTLAVLHCTLVLARTTQRARLELSGQPTPYACGTLPAGTGPRMRVRSHVRVSNGSPLRVPG